MQTKAIKSAKTEIKTNKRKRRAVCFFIQERQTISSSSARRFWGILNGCKLFAYYYIYKVCKRRALFFILGTSKDQRQRISSGHTISNGNGWGILSSSAGTDETAGTNSGTANGTGWDQRQRIRNGHGGNGGHEFRNGNGTGWDQRQRIRNGRGHYPQPRRPRRTQGQVSVAASVRVFQSTPFMFQKCRF